MENQCVTAQEIADAFMQLLRVDSYFLIVTVFAVVFIIQAPHIINRLIDIYVDRKLKNGNS